MNNQFQDWLLDRNDTPACKQRISTNYIQTNVNQRVAIQDSPLPSVRLKLLILFLKAVLWLTLWMLFIHLEFGAVYLIISLLILIYRNTSTIRRNIYTPSAYSVFNPNCERIDGTFTSEQFEKELRYGANSVR